MATLSPVQYEIEPSRSAYNGMIVAAPVAAAAWLLLLGALFLLV